MVLRVIKANFRCAELFSCERDYFFIVFLKYRDKQKNKKSSDKLEIPGGTKFLRVLIFTIFSIFPAIRNTNQSPPLPFKINENTFPAKIYSRVLNILWLKFTTQKYSTKKSCLFNYNSPLQFRNKTSTINWFYIMYEYRSTVWKSAFLLHPDRTYLTRTKILPMLGTGYFLKIDSEQLKLMCPNVVTAVRPFFPISQF